MRFRLMWLLALFLGAGLGTPLPAGADVPDAPTALDPQIKRGTLPNGLTYYVMAHKKPEQRAQLWLAVNTGSVMEDDDQRGLAHFVEHMAFNGTKHFPKQELVNFIEKIGMRFGADVNAYTSFDETVYMLTVPTDDQATLMKGLDVLRDWAGDVSFDPVEVDKERGVVLEEWRLNRSAFARVRDKQLPVIFQGSRYATRLPIGQPQTLKTAPREALVRFYRDWYQPRNMAIIAVGDFDPAAMEKEIIARFGDIPPTEKARERAPVPVPHDQETAITLATDPELPFTRVSIQDKLDHRREETRLDYRQFIVEMLYHQMLNARFAELAQDPAAPFTSAFSSTSELTRTCDAFSRQASVKEGRTAEAVAVLFREVARVEKHGFLPAELERARRQVLSSTEQGAAEWEKTPSGDLADEMTRNFFTREQMPGRAWELQATREMLPGITLEELNHQARSWGGERGRVIAVSGPAAKKLPTEPELRALIKKTAAETLEPWQEAAADRPLMAKAPTPGKVVATKADAAAGATVWTLANGVRVIVKPTTFQNDEVQITAWKPGGSSLVADRDFADARFAAQVAEASGAGDFDPAALRRALAGKMLHVSVYIGELSEEVDATARPADLEAALTLLHLRLTAPRHDPRAFAAWQAKQREFWRRFKDMPEMAFSNSVRSLLSGDHPRRRPPTAKMIDEVNLDRALAVYKQRFADLGGFTFVIVGNVDPVKLQPLVETYLGSLPSAGGHEKWKDLGIKPPRGKVEKSFAFGKEPKSRVERTMSADEPWTRDGARDAETLTTVLSMRLREVLREDLGGVYGVYASAGLSREPTQRRTLRVSFGCDPANVAKLRAAVWTELTKIAAEGIGDSYLEKVREQVRRARETDLKENRWWVDNLREAYYFGDGFAEANDLDAQLTRVTAANVKAAARRFLDEKNVVTAVLVPAK